MCVCERQRYTQREATLLMGLASSANAGSWVIRAQGEDIPSSSLTANDGKGLSQRSALPLVAVMADDITY